jgi:hypothetical protein
MLLQVRKGEGLCHKHRQESGRVKEGRSKEITLYHCVSQQERREEEMG